MPTNFEKILIIKPSSLGDIVLALPALSALRINFPDLRLPIDNWKSKIESNCPKFCGWSFSA